MPKDDILVFWIGIIGIPGKGAAWIEPYNPNITIGDIITKMTNARLGESNKRIEIFKFERGNLNKYDRNNPYWSHDTKISEYVNIMNDTMLIYCII